MECGSSYLYSDKMEIELLRTIFCTLGIRSVDIFFQREPFLVKPFPFPLLIFHQAPASDISKVVPSILSRKPDHTWQRLSLQINQLHSVNSSLYLLLLNYCKSLFWIIFYLIYFNKCGYCGSNAVVASYFPHLPVYIDGLLRFRFTWVDVIFFFFYIHFGITFTLTLFRIELFIWFRDEPNLSFIIIYVLLIKETIHLSEFWVFSVQSLMLSFSLGNHSDVIYKLFISTLQK